MCPCGNGADRGWESKVKTLRPVKAAVWTICHLDGFFPLLVWRCPSFRCFEANLSRYCPSVWNTEWLTKMGTFFHIGWYNPLFGTFDGYVTLSNSFPFLHNFFWSGCIISHFSHFNFLTRFSSTGGPTSRSCRWWHCPVFSLPGAQQMGHWNSATNFTLPDLGRQVKHTIWPS